MKSIPSVTENIWSACVCSIHHTSTLGCVQSLALVETMGGLGSALGGGRETGGLQRHLADQNGHQNFRCKWDFLSKQEQQSLVPLFIDAS